MTKRERALDLVRTLSPAKGGDDSDLNEMATIVSGALEQQVSEFLRPRESVC